MKNPVARFVGLAPGKNGILVTLRLGPNTTKEQIETWMGEEDALVGLIHPPAHIQLKSPKPTPKGGDKCKWLGARCKDKLFYDWLLSAGLIGHIDSNKQLAETNAVKAVQLACGVRSRAEIDSNEEAALLFVKQIQHPFARYVKGKGK